MVCAVHCITGRLMSSPIQKTAPLLFLFNLYLLDLSLLVNFRTNLFRNLVHFYLIYTAFWILHLTSLVWDQQLLGSSASFFVHVAEVQSKRPYSITVWSVLTASWSLNTCAGFQHLKGGEGLIATPSMWKYKVNIMKFLWNYFKIVGPNFRL